MKKNLSYIYRLCFIIFAIWGIFEHTEYTFSPEKLFRFVPTVIFACLICITIVFILSLKSVSKGAILSVKGFCTLLSVIVLVLNGGIIFDFFTKGWILGVLLPVMMITDWLIFDKKGGFSFKNLLMWLGIIIVGLLLINYAFGSMPFLSDIIEFLKNPENLTKLALGLGGAALAMYILDALLSGSPLDKLSVIFRPLFLVLEAYCFKQTANHSMGNFITELKYYSLFINFLCFLCIAVLVIRSVFVKASKNSEIYTRIKNGLAAAAAVLPVFFGMYGGDIFGGGAVCIILCAVCPLMMVADCLLFDRKNTLKVYDPCLYVIVPLVHFAVTYFVLRPFYGLTTYSHISYPAFVMLGMGTATVLALGYALFAINKIRQK